mmetsp:Transcript_70858/g.207904  ORF Transcript_70858/g.207904 Transcript_70858/m.207904 type:complete len:369 (+) Transcript_70858:1566-2672(+)
MHHAGVGARLHRLGRGVVYVAVHVVQAEPFGALLLRHAGAQDGEHPVEHLVVLELLLQVQLVRQRGAGHLLSGHLGRGLGGEGERDEEQLRDLREAEVLLQGLQEGQHEVPEHLARQIRGREEQVRGVQHGDQLRDDGRQPAHPQRGAVIVHRQQGLHGALDAERQDAHAGDALVELHGRVRAEGVLQLLPVGDGVKEDAHQLADRGVRVHDLLVRGARRPGPARVELDQRRHHRLEPLRDALLGVGHGHAEEPPGVQRRALPEVHHVVERGLDVPASVRAHPVARPEPRARELLVDSQVPEGGPRVVPARQRHLLAQVLLLLPAARRGELVPFLVLLQGPLAHHVGARGDGPLHDVAGDAAARPEAE